MFVVNQRFFSYLSTVAVPEASCDYFSKAIPLKGNRDQVYFLFIEMHAVLFVSVNATETRTFQAQNVPETA